MLIESVFASLMRPSSLKFAIMLAIFACYLLLNYQSLSTEYTIVVSIISNRIFYLTNLAVQYVYSNTLPSLDEVNQTLLLVRNTTEDIGNALQKHGVPQRTLIQIVSLGMGGLGDLKAGLTFGILTLNFIWYSLASCIIELTKIINNKIQKPKSRRSKRR